MTEIQTTGVTENQKRTIAEGNIAQIARLIREDWSSRGKGVNFAAIPYLQAMLQMDKVTDYYGRDSGKGVILYFLSNASSYRGDVARLVKVELKKRLKA